MPGQSDRRLRQRRWRACGYAPPPSARTRCWPASSRWWIRPRRANCPSKAGWTGLPPYSCPSVMAVSGLTFVGWLAAGRKRPDGLDQRHRRAARRLSLRPGAGDAGRDHGRHGRGGARGAFSSATAKAWKWPRSSPSWCSTRPAPSPKASPESWISSSSPAETDGRILSLAASAEFGSEHYLGKALTAKAQRRKVCPSWRRKV